MRVQSGAESGSSSPTSIEQTCRMIYIESFYIESFSARNKANSIKNQTEIVKWVIGHQALIQYYYPQMAEFRQKHWVSVIDDGNAANEYRKLHMPRIDIK
jgi:hypothetical protein